MGRTTPSYPSNRSDYDEADIEPSYTVSSTIPARRYDVAFDESRIDPDVQKVLWRLTRNGHEAYLVGGCVRDLLLDRSPKDFDVATSARPEQVRDLFRNSRIIGRRFRLVHVLFQGGKMIEVANKERRNSLRASHPSPNRVHTKNTSSGPSSSEI